MAEEKFFSLFMEELQGELKKFQVKKDSSILFTDDIYPKYWNPCEKSKEVRSPVIACDGSLGSSSFSGGLVIWVARAVSHTYTEESIVKASPEVGVKMGYRLEGQSFFMRTVEFRALRKAVEELLNEYGSVFVLVDGSLYFTFFHHRPHIEARKELLQEFVHELRSFLELGLRDNVTVIGVSKDSDVTYLRAHILVEHLKDRFGELGYFRSIKWMRQKIEKERGLLDDPSLKDYLKEIENDESDEAVFDKTMKEPGFSTPLLLAPQTCYMMQEVEGSQRWRDSRLRLSSPASFTPLLEEMDKLYELPPLALSYWKPNHGRRIYRLDIPARLLGCKIRCEDLTNDELMDAEAIAHMEDLVAPLNWLEKEAYGMRPLIDVDEVARLIRRRYRSTYEPVILQELQAQGFEVKPRKRSVRDDFMRRY